MIARSPNFTNPAQTTRSLTPRAPRRRAARGMVRVTCMAVIAVCLCISIFLTTTIAASSGRHQLVYTDRAEDGMSRDEALGIAVGAFRGLFVNVLWMRAHELKQDGKFHEAVDLARTITRLQPRFPRVWAFHAWNLAYNISVATNTPQERWAWVNAGIRLLRDEGIPQNPSDLLLHKELSWLFLHKVQMLMDDANQFYKRQFAVEWTIAMGTPPERTPQTQKTQDGIKAYVDNYLGPISAAPSSLEELYAKPGCENAKLIVDTLKEKMGMDVTTPLGRRMFLYQLEGLRSAIRQVNALRTANKDLNIAPPSSEFTELLIAPENLTARRELIHHLRKRMLIDEYHMEPERMIRFTQKYGPMDWRHPASHALYWAARGVEEALARVNDRTVGNNDFINTDRLVVQSLQELYRSGTLMFDISNPDLYVSLPNDYFIPSYGSVIKELMDREEQQYKETKGVDISGRTYRFYAAGYENFLHDAISFLYRRNQIDEAEKYRTELMTWSGGRGTEYDLRNDYWKAMPLDDFVIQNIKERITSPNIAMQEVAASIQSALINGLLAGDTDVYRRSMAYAERFHHEFTKEQWRVTGVDTNTARMGVMQQDFRELAGFYSAFMLRAAGLTNSLVIYSRMAEDQRVWTYDTLLDMNIPRGLSEQDAAAAQAEFAKLYPKPQGLDDFRALRAAQQRVKEQRGASELK